MEPKVLKYVGVGNGGVEVLTENELRLVQGEGELELGEAASLVICSGTIFQEEKGEIEVSLIMHRQTCNEASISDTGEVININLGEGEQVGKVIWMNGFSKYNDVSVSHISRITLYHRVIGDRKSFTVVFIPGEEDNLKRDALLQVIRYTLNEMKEIAVGNRYDRESVLERMMEVIEDEDFILS
jgi:hypothetical protein